MRKGKILFAVFAAAIVMGTFTVASSHAGMASTKAAVAVSDSKLLGTEYDVWTPILSAAIKLPEQKDLYMGVSLVTSLFTQTLVKSKGGQKDESTAEVKVEVLVVVDPDPALAPESQRVAAPGPVVFDRRMQHLMAKFGGVLDCADQNGDGVITFDECILTDEELNLILDTEAAHHFNFVLDDIGVGEHIVQVYARLSRSPSNDPKASASAFVGKGSLTIEEVRLAKDVSM